MSNDIFLCVFNAHWTILRTFNLLSSFFIWRREAFLRFGWVFQYCFIIEMRELNKYLRKIFWNSFSFIFLFFFWIYHHLKGLLALLFSHINWKIKLKNKHCKWYENRRAHPGCSLVLFSVHSTSQSSSLDEAFYRSPLSVHRFTHSSLTPSHIQHE